MLAVGRKLAAELESGRHRAVQVRHIEMGSTRAQHRYGIGP